LADFRYPALPLIVLLTLAAGEAAAQARNPNAAASARETQVPPNSHGENFSAGKSPSQLFASDCTGSGCHRGPQGLAKDWSPGGLSGFLREHYTNSRESAAALAGYLVSVGGDPRAARPEPAQRSRTGTRQDDANKRGEETPPRPRRAVPTEPEARPEASRSETPRPAAQPRQQQRSRQTTSAPASAPASEPAAPTPDTEVPAAAVAPAPEAATPSASPQFDIFD
jgi:hypothetical protein